MVIFHSYVNVYQRVYNRYWSIAKSIVQSFAQPMPHGVLQRHRTVAHHDAFEGAQWSRFKDLVVIIIQHLQWMGEGKIDRKPLTLDLPSGNQTWQLDAIGNPLGYPKSNHQTCLSLWFHTHYKYWGTPLRHYWLPSLYHTLMQYPQCLGPHFISIDPWKTKTCGFPDVSRG